MLTRSELKTELLKALNRSLGPDEAARFATTMKQWGNMKTLEKAAARDGSGTVSPAALANTLRSKNPQAFIYGKGDNELVDIGHVGETFLKDRIGDSGTAPRMMSQRGLVDLLVSGGIGLTAGRGVNAALSSNWLNNYLRHGAPKLAGVARGANALLPISAIAAANTVR